MSSEAEKGLRMRYKTPAKCNIFAPIDQTGTTFQAERTNPFVARIWRGLFRASLEDTFHVQSLRFI